MQCATYQHYSITQATFNISSDSAMLAIPIPLLMKTQMRLKKKLLLLCIMSLGVFTIVAAVLNKYFNFASPYTTIYQIWYIREASTGIYVANIMCLWPLLRKLFGLKAFQNSSRRQDGQAKESGCLSQSRPSFSFTRSVQRIRAECGKNPGAYSANHKDERRLSQAAIYSGTTEGVPLDDRITVETTIDVEEGMKKSQTRDRNDFHFFDDSQESLSCDDPYHRSSHHRYSAYGR